MKNLIGLPLSGIDNFLQNRTIVSKEIIYSTKDF